MAGLAFTLTLIDELTPGELTGGNLVAVTGTISIDKNRDAKKSAVIVEMKGGKPVYAATVEPSKKPGSSAVDANTRRFASAPVARS